MRGKLVRQVHHDFRRGITPACAGKTPANAECVDSGKDHPRVCGENRFLVIIQFSVLGSPPRVRGKPAKNVKTGAEERITPACAGKTEYDDREGEVIEDHPRVCGENRQSRFVNSLL